MTIVLWCLVCFLSVTCYVLAAAVVAAEGDERRCESCYTLRSWRRQSASWYPCSLPLCNRFDVDVDDMESSRWSSMTLRN
jgi:hypothetical protein